MMTAAEHRRALEEAEELLAEDLQLDLTLEAEIGLAMRAARAAARASQRGYAQQQCWSASVQSRAEVRAGGLRSARVLEMLAATEFTLCVVGDVGRAGSARYGGVVPLTTPADLSGWIVARSREHGLTTGAVAERAHTSQTMVCRSRSATRIGSVRLEVVERIVHALGGSLRIAWDDTGGPELIEPWDWPTAALVPRSYGNSRRLAAHGPIRRAVFGPNWWIAAYSTQVREWDRRPRWTAEADGTADGPARSPIAPTRPPPLRLTDA